MTVELSRENKSAYFTSGEEALTLLRLADELWGLNGKTAIEPSVGSGVFVTAAAGAGFDLSWTTNELYPEHTNFIPDTHEDFLTLPPERKDFVIGNPPYSGTVSYDDKKMKTQDAFIHRSFLWADRVAFVLPLSALRPKTLSQLPEGVEVVAWTEPVRQVYTLSGVGGGSQKTVRTVICFFEKNGFSGYPFDGSPVPGLEWVEFGDPRATHGISVWGTPGRAKALNGSYGPREKLSNEQHCVITDPRIEKIVASGFLRKYCSNWTTAIPFVAKDEFNWYFRCLLDQWPE